MERRGWISLGDSYLQQQCLYEFNWNSITIDAFHVAISISGAFIATARNDKVPLLLPSYSPIVQPISIFSGSGKLLHSIPWDREHTSILNLGWTEDSRCVLVLDDATIRLYSLYGTFETFDLGQEVKEQGISSCMIHPNGMVIATRKGKFFVISNWQLPIPKHYSHFVAPESALHHWTSISSTSSTSGALEIFIPLPESLVIVSEFNVEAKNLVGILSVYISPSMTFWACLTSTNMLEIRLSQSEYSESRFSLKPYLNIKTDPIQIKWCGDDAILIATSSNLIFLHISGQTFITDLFDNVTLSSTMDGCFILSNLELSLVTPVHHTVQKIFQVGSKHPAAILLDSLEQYQKKAPQTMELIENLMQGSQFYTAIAACLESSQYIWNVKLQKNLVQAAQFGRVWCSSITIRDNLVSTCQRLRVMNALRAIGIPCTLSLYNKLGLPGLIDLLLAARQHGIAYQIAKTFHLSATNIVFHWAKLKITLTKDYDVDSLVATLNERLSLNKTNINHAELAKTAYASGHLLLATKLLNFETRPQEQIPLLLEMNQSELALEKAVDSLDSDLTFLVLIFLRKKLKLNEFFTVIKSCPRSIPYLIHYGKENDRSLLRDFYFLDDQHAAMGDLLMEDVVSAKNVEEKIALLRDAITCFSRSKLCLSQQKAAEQYLELLHQQAILKTQFPNCIEIGEPLCQTIFHLIEHGHLESAIKLKNSFHVSENRFSWIAIRAYINVRRLNDLDAYVHRSKRPPLCGFQAIVQELIHSKLFEEAKKYVAKCELHSRIPFYLQMNYLTDAAQICFQSGDLNGLTEIRMKAEDPLTIQQIDQLMEELKSKR